MSDTKTKEILHSIISQSFASELSDPLLADHLKEAGWEQQLSAKLRDELKVYITAEEIRSVSCFGKLVEIVEPRLARDSKGRTLAGIYALLEQFVREELSHHARIILFSMSCDGS